MNPPTGAGSGNAELVSSCPRHSMNPSLIYESENAGSSIKPRQNRKGDRCNTGRDFSPSSVSTPLPEQGTRISTSVLSTMSSTAVSKPRNRNSSPVLDSTGTSSTSTPLSSPSCSIPTITSEKRASRTPPGPGLQKERKRKPLVTTSAQKRLKQRQRDEIHTSMLKTQKYIRKACKAALTMAEKYNIFVSSSDSEN